SYPTTSAVAHGRRVRFVSGVRPRPTSRSHHSSATPVPLVSRSTVRKGACITYTRPSWHARPWIELNSLAKTVDLSAYPSPSVSSTTRISSPRTHLPPTPPPLSIPT